MRHARETKSQKRMSFLSNVLFFPITILFLESFLSIFCFGHINSFIYILITSTFLGFLLNLATNFKNKKLSYALSIFFTLIFSILYIAQVIYFKLFGTFFTITSLGMATDAMNFTEIVTTAIFSNVLAILVMLIPFVICLFRFKFQKQTVQLFNVLIFAISFIVLFFASLFLKTGFLVSEKNHNSFTSEYSATGALECFGFVLATNADFNQLMGWNEVKLEIPTVTPTPTVSPTPDTSSKDESSQGVVVTPSPTPVPVKDQVMDIDFAGLALTETNSNVKKLHEYFAQAPIQKQNEYTGMFEGKNLIFLTAESFSHYAIDKELTPTLYKLYSEGFQFKNFYTPGWGVSTTDGEYVACNGLIPKAGVRSFTEAAENYLPFTMGRQALKYGYSPVVAYHNHTYTYYSRHLSHPNMGYVYKGVGNGLDVAKTWPESDLEMMQKTTAEYINGDEPFHAYYMTVSGHLNYTFIGNSMSYKNRDLVESLPYSTGPKAYLAANIELDRALEYLIVELKKAGKYDDTVIALSADHYPYGLTLSELEEFGRGDVDETFEKYRNAFLLWSGSMEEPIVVDKYAQSLDIIPTLSNLMGFEYDSRLLMGNDIMSDDYEPIVVFNDRSFITELGKYSSKTGDFTLFDQSTQLPENYVSDKKKIMNNKFEISKLILENDYYSYVID